MHLSSITAGALALAPQLASAHFLFPHLMLNGVKTEAYEYVREHDFGFNPHKTDWINSEDFRCNEGSWNHRNDPKTAEVTAGQDVVGFNLHLDFAIYHPGPVTIYLSKAPGDVREYDGSGDWFKVYQLGTQIPWNGTDQGWLTWDQKNFQFTLPNEIPAGEYLMRIEQMSVHQPYREKEWYVQCAHLKIASSYDGPDPSPTIKFPGGYNINDEAIQLDSWAQPPPTYAAMPGPEQWPN
ncbi:glycosyl hydrolase family 61-domain-containing protein [Chaetomium sp. MPI-SDFR-AT-0129]|uniref:lytic cellulose monooxygenase (C4-dehydrogenating) n=1 Tax=Dichotomopilus funicola TaxID=1934379 RepID=A0AAN6UWT8_9PEZI|nr:glycosyl hydrolase family 61-domain-containing protein [Chaetomium sp. MPI-SDFR-AT-0129]KAK4140673.1 family 61 putative glycoside hydrolase [Dichotomopilus funicola]